MCTTRRIAACVFLAALTGCGARQPSTAAAPASEELLGNGVRVLYRPDPDAFVTTVSLTFRGGLAVRSFKPGLPHLVEHLVMRTSGHIDRETHDNIDTQIGASHEGATMSDWMLYFTASMPSRLETLLWLQSDRLGYFLDGLTEDDIKAEVQIVKQELERGLQRADSAGKLALDELAFPAPSAQFRSLAEEIAELDRITISDVRAFAASHHVPCNATFIIAGRFDLAQARRLVDKYVATLPPRACPRLAPRTAEPAPRTGNHRIVAGVPAPRVFIGWRAVSGTHPTAPATWLAAEVLGRADDGVIATALRTAGIEASVTCNVDERADGSLFYCGFAPGEGSEVSTISRTVSAAIQTVQQRGLPRGSLEAAKTSFVRGVASLLEGPLEYAFLSGQRYYTSDDKQCCGRWLQQIKELTEADVMNSLRAFTPERAIVLELAPEGSTR